MSVVERSPWNVTKEFLRMNGVEVDKVNDKGIVVFNCLEYTEIEDGIMLTRVTESNPSVSFSLEFKRKAAEKGLAVSVTCKLVTVSPEQLRELFIKDPYHAYGQDGTIHLARVQQVRLGNPRLAIYSFSRSNFKSLDLTTGGVTSIAKYISI